MAHRVDFSKAAGVTKTFMMENLVISSTSTCKHPKLEQLNKAVEHMVSVFEAIPLELQMDGLDIIQGVVSLIMQKITHGRITAVKFVPFEKTETPSADQVKPEPIELNSDSDTTEEPARITASKTTAESTVQRRVVDEEVSTTRKPTKKSGQAQTKGRKQVTKRRQLAAKPVGHIMNFNELSEGNLLAIEKALKEKTVMKESLKTEGMKEDGASTPGTSTLCNSDPGNSTEGNSTLGNSTPGNSTQGSSTQGDSSTGNSMPGTSTPGITPAEKPARKRGRPTTRVRKKDETEPEAQINAPVVPQSTEFKTPEEIRAMFPAEIFTPKKKRPHWKDKADPEKKRLTCTQCPYFTHKEEDMAVHVMAHSGNITCQQCDKQFTSTGSLKRHLLIHRGERAFPCPLCARPFLTAADLRQHAVTHTGERPHACHTCGKTYTLAANLSRHMRAHTGEKPYACSICEAAFQDYTSLKFHQLKHTGEKPYPCDACSKAFRTSSDLQRHRRIHSDTRSYTCHVCARGFKQRSTLNAHLQVHTEESPHGCLECGKRFRSRASLQHHARSHAGLKPYKCETCAKCFTTKSYLASHQILHGVGERHECRECHQLFNHRANLARHQRIHSAERRYKCRFCAKAFKYSNALAYHEGIHTGHKQVCEKCGKAFRSKGAMKKHLCKTPATVKQEQDTTLQAITPDTSQSLVEAKPKADVSPRKLIVKISPKKRKKEEELVRSHNLKPVCIRLQKLNIDLKTVLESSRRASDLSEAPPSKCVRYAETEIPGVLIDVKREPEDVADEEESVSSAELLGDVSGDVGNNTATKKASESNLVKKRNTKKRRTHKRGKNIALGHADETIRNVPSVSEQSGKASEDINMEEDTKPVMDIDQDDDEILDVEGDILNDVPSKEKVLKEKDGKCQKGMLCGEDFIVSLNEDFDELSPDEEEQNEEMEISNGNEDVTKESRVSSQNREICDEVTDEEMQANTEENSTDKDVIDATSSECIVTPNKEQPPKSKLSQNEPSEVNTEDGNNGTLTPNAKLSQNLSQNSKRQATEGTSKDDPSKGDPSRDVPAKDTASQSSEEIDVISVMENVMNDFLEEEQKRKEQEAADTTAIGTGTLIQHGSSGEETKNNGLKSTEASIKTGLILDTTDVGHGRFIEDRLCCEETKDNCGVNPMEPTEVRKGLGEEDNQKTGEVESEEETVKNEILQKLKAISGEKE